MQQLQLHQGITSKRLVILLSHGRRIIITYSFPVHSLDLVVYTISYIVRLNTFFVHAGAVVRSPLYYYHIMMCTTRISSILCAYTSHVGRNFILMENRWFIPRPNRLLLYDTVSTHVCLSFVLVHIVCVRVSTRVFSPIRLITPFSRRSPARSFYFAFAVSPRLPRRTP